MQLYHNWDWNPLGLYVPISVTHDIHHILRGANGAEVEKLKKKLITKQHNVQSRAICLDDNNNDMA